jgi:hypothetical protein
VIVRSLRLAAQQITENLSDSISQLVLLVVALAEKNAEPPKELAPAAVWISFFLFALVVSLFVFVLPSLLYVARAGLHSSSTLAPHCVRAMHRITLSLSAHCRRCG